MSRRGAAWLLAIPLSLTGSECAHWLAYRTVYPDPVLRAQVLAAGGHGYLSLEPAAAALAVAIVTVSLAARIVAGRRAGTQASPSARPFLVVAPLAFALQECGEELATGHLPTLALYAPTFLPGLVLALPFGLVAYVLARALVRGADRLAAIRLRGGVVPARRGSSVARRPPAPSPPLRRRPLLGGVAERGPPPWAAGA